MKLKFWKSKENVLSCPCCGKDIKGNVHDITVKQILNDTNNFFNIINLCPHCGYVYLFDQEVTSFMEDCSNTKIYIDIKENKELHEGFKKWLLYAMINFESENYTLAGLSYIKLYDYMELSQKEPENTFLEHVSFCFWQNALNDNSFVDAYMTIDCKRRMKKFEEARNMLLKVKDIFTEEEYLLLLDMNYPI